MNRYIILDTNIYYEQFWLRHTNMQILTDSLKMLNIFWVMPHVVFDEIIAKYRKYLEENYKELRLRSNRVSRNLSRNDIIPELSLDINQEVETYRSFLEIFFSKGNRKIFPYPKVNHENIVDRAVKKRKPFNSQGKGYRDTLIWENLKEILHENQDAKVIFVTKNTNDYFGDKSDLHDDLRQDLQENEIGIDRVKLHGSLTEMFKKEISDEFLPQEKIKRQFKKNEWEVISHEGLFEYLDEFVTEQEIKIDLPDGNDEMVYLESIDGMKIGTIDDILQFPDNEVYLSFQVKANCILSYLVDKRDLYPNESKEYHVIDIGWNEHSAEVEITRDVIIQVMIVVNTETKLFESFDYEFINE
ncbi:DUF4935 domain-containing protein [bacterium]|nr:DUF4935 domain-containing protein [bacterium]